MNAPNSTSCAAAELATTDTVGKPDINVGLEQAQERKSRPKNEMTVPDLQPQPVISKRAKWLAPLQLDPIQSQNAIFTGLRHGSARTPM